MKVLKLGFLSTLVVFLIGFTGASAQEVFVADLSGDQVNPAVSTDASGTAVALLVGNVLVVGGTYDDLSSAVASQIAGGLHIHEAERGSNGGVVFVVSNDGGTAGTFSGTFILSDEQVAALQAGHYYLNLHTANHNPGEIRGQLEQR
ncbi:MAG: CHRD domain-containing protein [Trueperaceae bacterium]|nr:MAG: CHRD domain-containing protein [Trueperaceae bacterium]